MKFQLGTIFSLCMMLSVSHAFTKKTDIRSIKLNISECEVFCKGEILHHMQMSRVLNDSSAFFKYKLKYTPASVMQNFTTILNGTLNPSNATLLKFIGENFEPTDAYEKWVPIDWHPVPSFASEIYDSNLRNWVLEINAKWKQLGRKAKYNLLQHNDLYSSLYVPNPFVVPGGNFDDFYYWDSYWILEGLLISDMFQTCRYILENFLYLVNTLGYVPNGSQKYLLGRSQPPMLIPMFHLYYTRTKSYSFLENSIGILEKEFNFWIRHRSTPVLHRGIHYTVFQYKSSFDTPRPERYYNDVSFANTLNGSEKNEFYLNIRSAAESGWDFSSRWFLKDQNRTVNMSDINTNHLVPVCLNSILGYNAGILSAFYQVLGNEVKARKYSELAQTIDKTISRLFWDEDEGIWLDYNIISGKLQKGFYMSSLIPLWTETYGLERDRSYIVHRVLNYLNRHNISDYPGGMPTSLTNSHQQWDWPNGWAPLQHMTILGLEKASIYDKNAGELAFSIAKRWIFNCFNTYLNSTPPSLYEKYDVVHAGNPGNGGEYFVQKGFGWTNGVAIKILYVYGHKIRLGDRSDPVSIIVGIILIITTTAAIVNYFLGEKFSDKGSVTEYDVLLEKICEEEIDI